MKLSILIPSKRPSLLFQFINSLKHNSADFNSIELVILEDSVGEHLMYRDENEVRILHPKTPYVSDLLYECFANSTGDWIMFGNDDLIMETKNWDLYIKKAIEMFPDEIVMFYPNDTIFGQDFACFPIVSRKVLEVSNFFPLPNYRKYKIDDTLLQIMPRNRIFYLDQITLRHLNVIEDEKGVSSNGWGYKSINEYGIADHETFKNSFEKIVEMRKKLEAAMGELVHGNS